MDLQDLSLVFNRALSFTFSRKKLFLVFCILALSGLSIVFFRGLALHAGQWVRLSLTFLPIFICAGILLATGIFLIRVYHDEVKNREVNYRNILASSWELLIGSSYFAIPIILSYLLLWMLLGLFVLLGEIPGIGEFFSVILSFAPFIIHLGTLVLCLLSLGLLFFIGPVIALKGTDKGAIVRMTAERLKKDPFSNTLLMIISLLPALFILGLLILSAELTGTICLDCKTSLQTILKWFFMMLPFAAFLTPAVIFFFNYAAEAHILMRGRIGKG